MVSEPSVTLAACSSVTTPTARHGTSHFSKHVANGWHVVLRGDQQHALLGFGQHDLVAGHALFPAMNLIYVKGETSAAPGYGFNGGAGQAGGALGPAKRATLPVPKASRHASIKTFSRNGLPTWTVGRSSCSSSKVREAKPDAP